MTRYKIFKLLFILRKYKLYYKTTYFEFNFLTVHLLNLKLKVHLFYKCCSYDIHLGYFVDITIIDNVDKHLKI